MNKAPVLSELRTSAYEKITAKIHDHLYFGEGELFDKLFKKFTGWVDSGMKAQNDADHKHYQGIIREIFEEIEQHTRFLKDGEYIELAVDAAWYQSLKSKHQEEK